MSPERRTLILFAGLIAAIPLCSVLGAIGQLVLHLAGIGGPC